MPDIYQSAKRSQIMSRIRGKRNASTELRLIYLFKRCGITGWRRNSKLFGKPDFVFPKKRIALFVDGNFWHGHPTRSTIPKSNRSFWLKKITNNIKRDQLVNQTLKKMGWKVTRIWESDLRERIVLKFGIRSGLIPGSTGNLSASLPDIA